jgi:hypothetical protein
MNHGWRYIIWRSCLCLAGLWCTTFNVVYAQSRIELLGGQSPGGMLVDPSGLAVAVDVKIGTSQLQKTKRHYPKQQFVSLHRLGQLLTGKLPADIPPKKMAPKKMAPKTALTEGEGINPRKGIDDRSLYRIPLGGLQRIDYLLVYPDQNDIVLCGRGDEVVYEHEQPVGRTNGLPCLTVEDLRSCWVIVAKNRAKPFGCSIGPTAAGLQNLRQRLSSEPPPSTGDLALALGRQRIDLIRLPGKYSTGHSIVAADVRLKRLALGIDATGRFKLPRVQDLGEVMEGVIPRVWIGTNFSPILRSPDRRVWGLEGSFQVHLDFPNDLEPSSTERRRIDAWCEQWTAAVNDPQFTAPSIQHVRGISDLAVALALIQRYQLLPKPLVNARWTKGLTRDVRERSVPRWTESLCRIETKPRRLVAGGLLLSPWEATSLCEDQPQDLQLWQAGKPPDEKSTWAW